MAQWTKGKFGNPLGRPRRGQTITALLEQRLDKEQFVSKLIALASGGPGIDATTQLSAMRLILNYVDGLPIAKIEAEGGETVNIKVTYVQNNRIEVTGATPGAIEDHSRVETVQRLLPRAQGWQNSSGDGSPDSPGPGRQTDGVVGT